jgi:hypothetical protein
LQILLSARRLDLRPEMSIEMNGWETPMRRAKQEIVIPR